jgi:hypothetical protein
MAWQTSREMTVITDIDGKPLSADWIKDSTHWRGRVLTGRYRHWCIEWDFLPVDETSREWPCRCAPRLMKPTQPG